LVNATISVNGVLFLEYCKKILSDRSVFVNSLCVRSQDGRDGV